MMMILKNVVWHIDVADLTGWYIASDTLSMFNCGWKDFNWRNADSYLGVASQIGGAAQSAYCLCSQNESASHMTRTGEGGFCCSGLGSLGGGKPTDTTTGTERGTNGVSESPEQYEMHMTVRKRRGRNTRLKALRWLWKFIPIRVQTHICSSNPSVYLLCLSLPREY